MSNAFMDSAKRSKQEQEKIFEGKKSAGVETHSIRIQIPAALYKEIQLHRVNTGENFTQLIIRLLQNEVR